MPARQAIESRPRLFVAIPGQELVDVGHGRNPRVLIIPSLGTVIQLPVEDMARAPRNDRVDAREIDPLGEA
jgi:hypothetical protein